MNSHEMRLPVEGCDVVRHVDTSYGSDMSFYRATFDPAGLSRKGRIFNDGLVGVSTAPVSHRDDRVADMTQPIVRMTPGGALCRIGYNLDGQFRVELIDA